MADILQNTRGRRRYFENNLVSFEVDATDADPQGYEPVWKDFDQSLVSEEIA